MAIGVRQKTWGLIQNIFRLLQWNFAIKENLLKQTFLGAFNGSIVVSIINN
jgi:hypothetical protein